MRTTFRLLAVTTAVALLSLTAEPVATSTNDALPSPSASVEASVPVVSDGADQNVSLWRPHPQLNQMLAEALESGEIPREVIESFPSKTRRELLGMPTEMIPFHYRSAAEGGLQSEERGNPSNWKPDEPFNIAGTPVPSDQSVRIAIVNAVNWMLDQQREDGSWYTKLDAGLLAETADQAVDAVSYTSLAGLGLRPHVDVDPHRINEALRRGADFVCARIIRGKLSTQVYYACWRYIFGLRFLAKEYAYEKAKAQPDEARLEELELVVRRMLQSVLNMQLSSKDQGNVDGSRKRKVRSVGVKGDAQSARLGILLAPPTDEDFRGGALVLGLEAGLPAEKSGIRPGDRLVKVDRQRVENAYDFYLYEAEFMEGQRREVTIMRREGDSAPRPHKFNLHMVQRWPANIGVKIEAAGNEGVRVTGYTPASNVRKEVNIGELIIEIDRVSLVPDPKKPEEANIDWVQKFYEVESKLKPKSSTSIRILRDGRKRSIRLGSAEVRPKPEGDLGIIPLEEDRCSLIGVGVDDVIPNTPAKEIGIDKGYRIIEINGTPILGWDHYYAYMASLWMDTHVKIKYMVPRFAFSNEGGSSTPVETLNDESMYGIEEAEFRVGSSIEQGDPQFGLRVQVLNGVPMPVVAGIQKGGVSDGKLQVGDIIIQVGEMKIEHYFFIFFAFRNYGPGDVVEMIVNRNGRETPVEIELAKYVEEEEVSAEGGWNYYPRGLGTSFTTAAAVIALDEIEEVFGISYPRTSMRLAVGALNETRKPDPNNARLESYIYDQRDLSEAGADGLRRFTDHRGAMGRIIACELALYLKDPRRTARHLRGTMDLWLQNRYWLDRVRNFWHTHFYPEYANAAYYWFYAHYHAVLACEKMDPNGKDRTANKVREDVLKAVMLKLDDRRPGTVGAERPQGTWVEHHAFGPLVGTAQALMCLGSIPGGFRSGYTPPRREVTGEGGAVSPEDGAEGGGE